MTRYTETDHAYMVMEVLNAVMFLDALYEEDMYSIFCAFQDIVFGNCWIF